MAPNELNPDYYILSNGEKNGGSQRIEILSQAIKREIAEQLKKNLTASEQIDEHDVLLNVANTISAAEFSQAFSTHTASIIKDIYTERDERKPYSDEDAITYETELFSGSFYIYILLDLSALSETMKENTGIMVENFVKATISTSIGISSPANFTCPRFSYVSVSTERENFSKAFECPVRDQGEGLTKPSIYTFCSFAENTYNDKYEKPEKAYMAAPEYFEGTVCNAERTALFSLPKLISNEAEKCLKCDTLS